MFAAGSEKQRRDYSLIDLRLRFLIGAALRTLIKSLIVAAAVIASAASAGAAETWTCTYTADNQTTIKRFEVSPPNLIDVQFHLSYQIEKNNEYGLVATSSISEIERDQKLPTVGAASIVINKTTGEFWWVAAITGQPAAVNQPVQGKCIKD
jgi:hypothetical protein